MSWPEGRPSFCRRGARLTAEEQAQSRDFSRYLWRMRRHGFSCKRLALYHDLAVNTISDRSNWAAREARSNG